MAVRINRFLSQAGLGSRRKVETYVRSGQVRVNGVVTTDLSVRVDPEHDRVEFDGHRVRAPRAHRLLIFHKPRGVVCSFRRQGEAACLLDYVSRDEGRLFHVGRLDRETSGLLLLSDDGDLAHRLLHPSHPVWKTYRVELDGVLGKAALASFRDGHLVLDGRACAPAIIRRRPRDLGAVYEVRLREGRNRQIRRMFELLERRVVSLHREAFGALALGSLGVGQIRPATARETSALRDVTGEGPVRPPSASGVDSPGPAN